MQKVAWFLSGLRQGYPVSSRVTAYEMREPERDFPLLPSGEKCRAHARR